MAGEWQDMEDDGWEDMPDVNVINLPKSPTTIDVGGYQLPMPKYTLPEINVSGNPRLPSFKGIVDASKNKMVYDERANTNYLRGVQENRGQSALDRAVEMQNMPGISHGDLFSKEFPYAHPLAFLGGMVSSANLLDTEAPYIHPVNFWKNNPQTKLMINAGNTTQKIGAGTADIGNFLKFMVGTEGMQDSAIASKMRRAEEQAEGDRIFREASENKGLSGNLGDSLPYFATGALMGPAARSIAGKGVTALEKAVEVPVKAAGSNTVRAINAAAASTSAPMAPLRWAAQRAKTEFVDGMVRKAAQKAARIPMTQRYRVNLLRDILAGGGLGAAEGTMHYDRNPIEGAISGLLGTTAGKAIEAPFLRAPNYWSPNEQRLVDWMQDQGYRATPGMETGSRRLQKFEHGIREFDPTADHLGDIDRNNQMIFNRTAARTIGMHNPDGHPFDPKPLDKHFQGMKRDYDTAVLGTTGRLNKRNINNIMQVVDDLRLNMSPEAQKAYRVAQSYAEQMRAASQVTRGANGRFQAATFNGEDFQRINSAMREEVKSALARGELSTVNALQPMIREFGQGVDRGVLAHGGRTKLAEWKDLNERWAMANLLVDDGLDITGNVDLKKLGNHLMATDAKRTLTERGGRITDLQRLAKGAHMVRNQAGSGLSGANIINSGRQSFAQRMLQTPLLGRMPILPQLYMNMYLKGIPSTRGVGALLIPGFQGAKGHGAFTIPQSIRAIESGTERKTEAIESASEYLPQPMEDFIKTYLGTMRR